MRILVWSGKILSAIESAQRPFRAETFSFDILFFFTEKSMVSSAKRQQKAAFWSQTPIEFDGFDQNQWGPADRKGRSPSKEIFD